LRYCMWYGDSDRSTLNDKSMRDAKGETAAPCGGLSLIRLAAVGIVTSGAVKVWADKRVRLVNGDPIMVD